MMSDNTRTPYALIGGEAGVRALVDRFYDLMDQLPEAAAIRAMHAKSLRGSREKLFLFLSGWMGGPDLYQQKFGQPMLRRRHLPFPIGKDERDQWLLCMERALEEQVGDEALCAHLKQAFFQVADHMRNRAEVGESDGLRIVGAPAP
jgi:hemoglobin